MFPISFVTQIRPVFCGGTNAARKVIAGCTTPPLSDCIYITPPPVNMTAHSYKSITFSRFNWCEFRGRVQLLSPSAYSSTVSRATRCAICSCIPTNQRTKANRKLRQLKWKLQNWTRWWAIRNNQMLSLFHVIFFYHLLVLFVDFSVRILIIQSIKPSNGKQWLLCIQ